MEEACNDKVRTWNAPVFVQYNQVSDIVRSARLCKFLHHIITAIDAVRVGKDESHFLHIVSKISDSEKRTK